VEVAKNYKRDIEISCWVDSIGRDSRGDSILSYDKIFEAIDNFGKNCNKKSVLSYLLASYDLCSDYLETK